jgi:hypothetical protein
MRGYTKLPYFILLKMRFLISEVATPSFPGEKGREGLLAMTM